MSTSIVVLVLERIPDRTREEPPRDALRGYGDNNNIARFEFRWNDARGRHPD